ncbi:hypothetical protein BB558_007074 [Smittium angustum]|uniref:Chitin-binding type-2 domain-containing protein n=1 Tax=Smittium angustum TaxID=133377 RepID=A0A2U1IVZ8_SMIAN|nr:hypothetical protein BB558_007074 [Smittium angustum]
MRLLSSLTLFFGAAFVQLVSGQACTSGSSKCLGNYFIASCENGAFGPPKRCGSFQGCNVTDTSVICPEAPFCINLDGNNVCNISPLGLNLTQVSQDVKQTESPSPPSEGSPTGSATSSSGTESKTGTTSSSGTESKTGTTSSSGTESKTDTTSSTGTGSKTDTTSSTSTGSPTTTTPAATTTSKSSGESKLSKLSDQIIQNKLAVDEKTLLKFATNYLKVLENSKAFESDIQQLLPENGIPNKDDLNSVLIDLALFKQNIYRHVAFQKSLHKEIDFLESENNRIKEETMKSVGIISDLEQKLIQAKNLHDQKQEYDEISKKINELETRDNINRDLDILKNEILELENEQEMYPRFIESLQTQFLNCVEQLEKLSKCVEISQVSSTSNLELLKNLVGSKDINENDVKNNLMDVDNPEISTESINNATNQGNESDENEKHFLQKSVLNNMYNTGLVSSGNSTPTSKRKDILFKDDDMMDIEESRSINFENNFKAKSQINKVEIEENNTSKDDLSLADVLSSPLSSVPSELEDFGDISQDDPLDNSTKNPNFQPNNTVNKKLNEPLSEGEIGDDEE